MYFLETNIINQPKLNELVQLATPIFKPKGVITGDYTLTHFHILAYWTLFHRDNIDDKITFLEDCSNAIVADPQLFEAAVLYMNPTPINLKEYGVDADHAVAYHARHRNHYDFCYAYLDDLEMILPHGSNTYHGVLSLKRQITFGQLSDEHEFDATRFAIVA